MYLAVDIFCKMLVNTGGCMLYSEFNSYKNFYSKYIITGILEIERLEVLQLHDYPKIMTYRTAHEIVKQLSDEPPGDINVLRTLIPPQIDQDIINFAVGLFHDQSDEVRQVVEERLRVLLQPDALIPVESINRLLLAFRTKLPDNIYPVRAITVLETNPIGGSLATGHDDGSIMIWDNNGLHLTTHKSSDNCVTSLITMPENVLVSASDKSNNIVAWRYHVLDRGEEHFTTELPTHRRFERNRAGHLKRKRNTQGEFTTRGHDTLIRSIVHGPLQTGTFISSSTDAMIRIWRMKEADQNHQFDLYYQITYYYNHPDRLRQRVTIPGGNGDYEDLFNIGQGDNSQMPITLFQSSSTGAGDYIVSSLNTTNCVNRDVYFWRYPLHPGTLLNGPDIRIVNPIFDADASVKSIAQIKGTDRLAVGTTYKSGFTIFVYHINSVALAPVVYDRDTTPIIRAVSEHSENRIKTDSGALCSRLISPGDNLLVSLGGITTGLWRLEREQLVKVEINHGYHRVYDIVDFTDSHAYDKRSKSSTVTVLDDTVAAVPAVAASPAKEDDKKGTTAQVKAETVKKEDGGDVLTVKQLGVKVEREEQDHAVFDAGRQEPAAAAAAAPSPSLTGSAVVPAVQSLIFACGGEGSIEGLRLWKLKINGANQYETESDRRFPRFGLRSSHE